MAVKKSNIFLGLMLIFMGVDFLIHPVRYTYRVAYDVRGWLKWVASFVTIFPGAWLLTTAFYKGKLTTYYCPKCGKTEELMEGKKYTCSFCETEYERLDDLKEEEKENRLTNQRT